MNEISSFSDLSASAQIAIGIVIVAILALLAYTVFVWWKTPADRLHALPKWVWLIIILISQPIGPSAFLIFGRSNAPISEPVISTTDTVDVADLLYGKGKNQ